MLASVVSEGLGSFLLAAVVLVVATSRRTAGNSYFGLAIGLAWLGVVGAFAELAPLVNPLTSLLTACRGWVEALFDDTVGAKALVTESLLLAKVAPRVAGDIAAQFAGAGLAAWLFRTVLPEDR
jgi:glycerol uptake facilitator-like aquaporin